MEKLLKKVLKYNHYKSRYDLGVRYLNDSYHIEAGKKTQLEIRKLPLRTDIINFLIESLNKEINYLEIGVRNPDDNFNKISARNKYGVDPGYENKENDVDF